MAKFNDRRTARKDVGDKPKKPRPDFPLYPHLSGKWAKTIRGKTYYFGTWHNPHGAESAYLAVADDLCAGREPRANGSAGGTTMGDVCNQFMKAKRLRMEAGSLSPRTFAGYDAVCRLLIDTFGRNRLVTDLGPSNFTKLYGSLAKTYHGASSLGPRIVQVRSVFKFAFDADLIDKPVKYGPVFKTPSRTEVRKSTARTKAEHGGRTFTAEEVRAMIDAAPTAQLKAMILLGINAAFGNTDIAELPLSAVDLKKGIIDFSRPKSGGPRKVVLWPETVKALNVVITTRPDATDPADAGLVFITRFGQRWVRFTLAESKAYGKVTMKPRSDDGVAKQVGKLLKAIGLKRHGLSYYSLRHTFRTVADETKDIPAVRLVMGHAGGSIDSVYRESISDERLQAVTDHVHSWLWPAATAGDDAPQSECPTL
ncbi:MAG: tyrosine-type recombinase/integrase [Planctomycetaceae bacterium]